LRLVGEEDSGESKARQVRAKDAFGAIDNQAAFLF
jgi:hypothetical protein